MACPAPAALAGAAAMCAGQTTGRQAAWQPRRAETSEAQTPQAGARAAGGGGERPTEAGWRAWRLDLAWQRPLAAAATPPGPGAGCEAA